MLNLTTNKPELTLHQNEFFNLETASKLTGLCYSTFYAKVKKENLSHGRFNSKILFRRTDILKFISDHKAGDWSNIKNETKIISGKKCDLKEYSMRTDVPYQTLYSKVKQENIAHFKYGRKIIISVPVMNSYIKSVEEDEW